MDCHRCGTELSIDIRAACLLRANSALWSSKKECKHCSDPTNLRGLKNILVLNHQKTRLKHLEILLHHRRRKHQETKYVIIVCLSAVWFPIPAITLACQNNSSFTLIYFIYFTLPFVFKKIAPGFEELSSSPEHLVKDIPHSRPVFFETKASFARSLAHSVHIPILETRNEHNPQNVWYCDISISNLALPGNFPLYNPSVFSPSVWCSVTAAIGCSFSREIRYRCSNMNQERTQSANPKCPKSTICFFFFFLISGYVNNKNKDEKRTSYHLGFTSESDAQEQGWDASPSPP